MDSAQQAQMLSALENDPLWGRFNAEVHAHVRPFVVQLPVVLDELLEQRVTLQNFFEAKHRFLEWAMEHGYNLRGAAAILETYAMWLQNPQDAVPPGTSSEHYMLSIDLLDILKKRYQREILTIKDIVLYQPSVFLL